MSAFSKFTELEKAIAVGAYLSKFDRKALDEFGFTGFCNAYNIFGYSMGIVPKSIQNYRDEFDPLFPNPRKGWRNRKLRPYCKDVLDQINGLSFEDFTQLIKKFVIKDYEEKRFSEKAPKTDTWANRLATGNAAEEYFRLNYAEIPSFSGFSLKDTTELGCGFDFKLTNPSSFFCVEVKGLNTKTGNIVMTEKEFFVAQEVKDQYCLFVVVNFREHPKHKCFFNPVASGLNFIRTEREIIEVRFSVRV